MGRWSRASCCKYLKLVKPIRLASVMKSLALELELGRIIGMMVSARAGEGGRKPWSIFSAALRFISDRITALRDHSFLLDSANSLSDELVPSEKKMPAALRRRQLCEASAPTTGVPIVCKISARKRAPRCKRVRVQSVGNNTVDGPHAKYRERSLLLLVCFKFWCLPPSA